MEASHAIDVQVKSPQGKEALVGKALSLNLSKELPTALQPLITPRGQRLRAMQSAVQSSVAKGLQLSKIEITAHRSITSVANEISLLCSDASPALDDSVCIELEKIQTPNTAENEDTCTEQTQTDESARKVNEVFTLLEQADVLFSAFKQRLRWLAGTGAMLLVSLLLVTALLASQAREAVGDDFETSNKFQNHLKAAVTARADQKFAMLSFMLTPMMLRDFVPTIDQSGAVDTTNTTDPLVLDTTLAFHSDALHSFEQADREIRTMSDEIEEYDYFQFGTLASAMEHKMMSLVGRKVVAHTAMVSAAPQLELHSVGADTLLFDFEFKETTAYELKLRDSFQRKNREAVDRTMSLLDTLFALSVTCTVLVSLAAAVLPFVYRRTRFLRGTVDASLDKSQSFLRRVFAQESIPVEETGADAPPVAERRNSASQSSATQTSASSDISEISCDVGADTEKDQCEEADSHIDSLHEFTQRRGKQLTYFVALLMFGSFVGLLLNTLMIDGLRLRSVYFRDDTLLDTASAINGISRDAFNAMELFMKGRHDISEYSWALHPESPTVFVRSADIAFAQKGDIMLSIWEKNDEMAFSVFPALAAAFDTSLRGITKDLRTIVYIDARRGIRSDSDKTLNECDDYLESAEWNERVQEFFGLLDLLETSAFAALEVNNDKARREAAMIVASAVLLIVAVVATTALILLLDSHKRRSERLLWNASSWSLERVLADTEAHELFCDFARERYSENVLFLNAFASLHPKANGLTTRQALALAREFLWKGAPNQLNLPSHLVEQLMSTVPGWRTVSQTTSPRGDAVEAQRLINVVSDLEVSDCCLESFFEVQRTCYDLLSADILPEFLCSELFADFTAERRRQLEMQWALVTKYTLQSTVPVILDEEAAASALGYL
ncbi:MAG: hypothetical protein MHM6MM_000933 [Cercozoa sp. M6MM]